VGNAGEKDARASRLPEDAGEADSSGIAGGFEAAFEGHYSFVLFLFSVSEKQ